MTLIPVILSGGSGTRLWPVSRQAFPKPFMRLSDGETLLEKTLRRAAGLSSTGDILTVTGRDYFFITRDEYRRANIVKDENLHFLLEPVPRNTAPAVALAARAVAEKWGMDACMLVMPSDHVIRDEIRFGTAVEKAVAIATQGLLVTFGITPTHPETGYGYLHMGKPVGQGREVVQFVEKPELETARTYMDTGDHVWNSGMFCFTPRVFLEVLKQSANEIYQLTMDCWKRSQVSAEPLELDVETFQKLPNTSVDYAVMEKADNVAVVPGDFGWSDVGSWKAISELSDSDDAGNQVEGKAIMVDTKGTYVQGSNRLIATVGVENLVIVDTGDAVLVAHRERAQDVKTVVEQLKEEAHEAATYHQTVYRPWGSYTVLEDAEDCKVKRLIVKPGQVLSLQLHNRRSEHWTVVSGSAKVRVGNDEILLHQNQSIYIPTKTLHRLENPTEEDIALIEVQTGDYFGEDDIERFEDVYGRA